MNYTAEETAVVWLAAFSGLDPLRQIEVLRAVGDPGKLFDEKFPVPVINERAEGVYKEGSPAIRRKQTEEFLGDLAKKGYFAVTAASGDYPEALKFADSPLVLYGRGNRALLGEPKFCIVGSRLTPPWAEKLGSRMAEALTERFVIVTGLAEGGDLAAIRGALPSGRLISVLPCGLDECYPAAHSALKEEIAKSGLLLSEYLPGETARKYSFLARNRILAALSKGVLVLSAGRRSGALITAHDALDLGREVFAIPYNPGIAQGEGCNKLLKEGAYVCTEEKDIFDCFGMVAGEKKIQTLGAQEAEALEIIAEAGELHAAVVAERMGCRIHEAAALLSALELKGLVVKVGGNRYAKI